MGMGARAAAYRFRLRRPARAPIPVVSVGNLTVGGSGKTPVANWIARHYAAQGLQPAVVMRGYGGDEAPVHRRLAEDLVVIEDPDRFAGVRRAAEAGADVAVLDDGFQRLSLARDVNIALVSAESTRAVRWALPAGPWREPLRALHRADLVFVSRKMADADTAHALADRLQRLSRRPTGVVALQVPAFHGMISGTPVPRAQLTGRRVLVATGVADPESLVVQCRRLGARAVGLSFGDHHAYRDADVNAIVQSAAGLDYVVTTEKDAVKLRDRWPSDEPEPLVAELAVEWERGLEDLTAALNTVGGKERVVGSTFGRDRLSRGQSAGERL